MEMSAQALLIEAIELATQAVLRAEFLNAVTAQQQRLLDDQQRLIAVLCDERALLSKQLDAWCERSEYWQNRAEAAEEPCLN